MRRAAHTLRHSPGSRGLLLAVLAGAALVWQALARPPVSAQDFAFGACNQPVQGLTNTGVTGASTLNRYLNNGVTRESALDFVNGMRLALEGKGTGRTPLVSPTDLVVGNYNGDGCDDTAFVDRQTGQIQILMGDGQGTFGFWNNLSVNGTIASLSTTDVDADGISDLAVGETGARTGIEVFTGAYLLTGKPEPTFVPTGFDPMYLAGTTPPPGTTAPAYVLTAAGGSQGIAIQSAPTRPHDFNFTTGLKWVPLRYTAPANQPVDVSALALAPDRIFLGTNNGTNVVDLSQVAPPPSGTTGQPFDISLGDFGPQTTTGGDVKVTSVSTTPSPRKIAVRLDDLTGSAAAGPPLPVRLAFGVIVTGQGDSGGVNLQGFAVNQGTSPFDLSVFGFEPQPLDAADASDVVPYLPGGGGSPTVFVRHPAAGSTPASVEAIAVHPDGTLGMPVRTSASDSSSRAAAPTTANGAVTLFTAGGGAPPLLFMFDGNAGAEVKQATVLDGLQPQIANGVEQRLEQAAGQPLPPVFTGAFDTSVSLHVNFATGAWEPPGAVPSDCTGGGCGDALSAGTFGACPYDDQFCTPPSECTDGSCLDLSNYCTAENDYCSESDNVDPGAQDFFTGGYTPPPLERNSTYVPPSFPGQGALAAPPDDVWASRLLRAVGDWLLPAPLAADGPTVAIVANGASLGQSLEVQVTDRDGRVKTMAVPGGVVLQPVRGRAKPYGANARLPRNTIRQDVGAFCMNFAKEPPSPGQAYRFAPPAVQQQFAPLKKVMQAADRVAGQLHPDSEPTAYLNAIRQYALWSKIEGWDEAAFGKNFLERTKKNAQNAKVNWTQAMEATIQRVVPGRWRDIQTVLQAAN
jgi:hypothetical protein